MLESRIPSLASCLQATEWFADKGPMRDFHILQVESCTSNGDKEGA
jgi:hypothetical protein